MTGEGIVEQDSGRYTFLRFVADTLTVARFATAVFIVCLGLFVGPQALAAAVIATFVGWLTDIADGPVARISKGRQSWVARVDFMADIALGYSFFLFVVVTGLFPIIPALIFAALAGLAVLVHPSEQLIQIVTAPIFGLPVVLSFHAGLAIGVCYTVFLVTLLVFKRDRLVEEATRCHEVASALSTEE